MKMFGPDDVLSVKELRAFFGTCLPARDQALLLVAYRHGLRASEVGLLRVLDVDLRRRSLYCRRLRGACSGDQPLAPDERRALRPLLRGRGGLEPLFRSARGRAISRKRLDAIMKTCGAKAGLPPGKRHFQVLRTSLAAHLLRAGADLALVEEVLGYRSPPSTPRRSREIRAFLASSTLAGPPETA